MATLPFLLLPSHVYRVDNVDDDGQTPVRTRVSNVHLEMNGELLSNGGIVHSDQVSLQFP